MLAGEPSIEHAAARQESAQRFVVCAGAHDGVAMLQDKSAHVPRSPAEEEDSPFGIELGMWNRSQSDVRRSTVAALALSMAV